MQKLDKDYGLKDQSFVNAYLGVEVEQNENSIKIHQTNTVEKLLSDLILATHTRAEFRWKRHYD